MSAIGLIALGICAALSFGGGVVFGVLLLGRGIAWALLVKPTWHLSISSASGEADAVSSQDEEYINHVTSALNEALIKRG